MDFNERRAYQCQVDRQCLRATGLDTEEYGLLKERVGDARRQHMLDRKCDVCPYYAVSPSVAAAVKDCWGSMDGVNNTCQLKPTEFFRRCPEEMKWQQRHGWLAMGTARQ